MSGANSGSISTWGRSKGNENYISNYCSSNNKHGRITLASNGGGSRCSGSGDGGSGIRVGVGPTGRGRRRVAHPGPEAVPSVCLYHAWAGEGEEMGEWGEDNLK